MSHPHEALIRAEIAARKALDPLLDLERQIDRRAGRRLTCLCIGAAMLRNEITRRDNLIAVALAFTYVDCYGLAVRLLPQHGTYGKTPGGAHGHPVC